MTTRILAGAPTVDRRAFPRPGSVPRWFEPFHVRRPQVARGEMASQVAAGADVLMAPAWLTHRRALEAVGESRRAPAWTMAAVRLAREAVEAGLERREGGPGEPVLVAGPLPDVSARPEHATGRLLPASASEERDTHDQAGILADAGVDLLLLERRASFEATLAALRIVAQAGLPVWATIDPVDVPKEPPLVERTAMLGAEGAACVVLDVTAGDHAPVDATAVTMAGSTGSWGVLAGAPPLAADDGLDAWLAAGVGVLGLASGADPDALAPLVEARARMLRAAQEHDDLERTSLRAWVDDAARRAPGGRALWLGERELEPPEGFDWTCVDETGTPLASLPADAFRLVVAIGAVAPRSLARLVERGGIVALQSTEEAVDMLGDTGLRVRDLRASPHGRTRLILRREDA